MSCAVRAVLLGQVAADEVVSRRRMPKPDTAVAGHVRGVPGEGAAGGRAHQPLGNAGHQGTARVPGELGCVRGTVRPELTDLTASYAVTVSAADAGRVAANLGHGGDTPPLCPCHGVAMQPHGSRKGWRCIVKQREYSRRHRMARYYRLIAEGICGTCGKNPSVVGVRCFDCAVIHLDRNATYIR